jgi:hypothetical protein
LPNAALRPCSSRCRASNWAALCVGLAHAAIDVSDGLLADLGHILERSAVAAEVFVAQLPPLPAGVDPVLARQCQLAGGDDYELVFSAQPGKRPSLPHWPPSLICRSGAAAGSRCGPGRLTALDEDGQPSGHRWPGDSITLPIPIPSFAFLLMAHPAHLVACGFGSGLSPRAPGTVGTSSAGLSFLLLRRT